LRDAALKLSPRGSGKTNEGSIHQSATTPLDLIECDLIAGAVIKLVVRGLSCSAIN
jgi:hypothetical protein